jgi:hypothetical protein
MSRCGAGGTVDLKQTVDHGVFISFNHDDLKVTCFPAFTASASCMLPKSCNSQRQTSALGINAQL